MKLTEYLAGKPKGERVRLMRVTGLHQGTIARAINGLELNLTTAKLISDATGGAVTFEDLLPEPGAGKP